MISRRELLGSLPLFAGLRYPTSKSKEERRWKIIIVNPMLITVMLDGFKNNSCYMLPVDKNLPEGCRVVNVQYEFQTAALEVVVEHSSFEHVPPGNEIPKILGLYETETFVKRKLNEIFNVVAPS